MRITPTNLVRPGARLGRSLYDPNGRLVIAAGVTLRPKLLNQLERRGYSALYVADEFSDVDLPELVTFETKQEVTRSVTDYMQIEAMHAEQPPLGPDLLPSLPAKPSPNMVSRARHDLLVNVMKAADLLINDIMSRKEIIIGLVDIKSLHDYSFGHSVQVAMNSLVVAKILGYGRKELHDLGVGALLHDIGKAAVPSSLWMKPGDLTAEEFAMVKDHPTLGFEILRKTALGLMPAHTAYQHHERWDGSGYPRGIGGSDILKHARICAVCDVFDAMISDRPYKKAVHPHEALAFIVENSGILFDPDVVDAFSRVVAPFPVATGVVLSTGERAIVKRLNPRALDRPVVVITKDSEGRFYSSPRTVDLESQVELSIVNYAEWYAAPDRKAMMAACGIAVRALSDAEERL